MRNNLSVLIFAVLLLASGCASSPRTPLGDKSTPSLGCDLESDQGVKRAVKLSIEELRSGAEAGDAVSQTELGRRYGLGTGIPKDPQRSFFWYAKAANNNLCAGQSNLAFMYLSGEGTEKDFNLARFWYNKAAESGYAQAQFGLGYMAVMGLGQVKDGLVAERWFLAAANQGYLSAQYSLMNLYIDDTLLPRNPLYAALWQKRIRSARLSGIPWRQND
jgi:uncharacterized protein